MASILASAFHPQRKALATLATTALLTSFVTHRLLWSHHLSCIWTALYELEGANAIGVVSATRPNGAGDPKGDPFENGRWPSLPPRHLNRKYALPTVEQQKPVSLTPSFLETKNPRPTVSDCPPSN